MEDLIGRSEPSQNYSLPPALNYLDFPSACKKHDLDSLLVDTLIPNSPNFLNEALEKFHEPQSACEEVVMNSPEPTLRDDSAGPARDPAQKIFTELSISNISRSERARPSRMIGRDSIVLTEKVVNPSLLLPFTLPKLVDNNEAEPNFTLPQLIIMALVSTPNRTLSIPQMVKWIEDSFEFYFYLTLYQKSNSSTGEVEWIRRVKSFLQQYDFPTEPVYFNQDEEIRFRLEDGGEWFILPRPDIVESFSLMKLPLELRLLIYHWVLYRPLPRNHGWVIDPEYTEHRVTRYNEYNHMPQYLTTPIPGGWELRTPRLDKVLALLSTNRQIKEEATPVFYRSNSFYFDSCRTMHSFLSGLPHRFRFVRNIILNYKPTSRGNHCNRAFALLHEVKVRNIHLIVNEDEVLDRQRGFDAVDHLPGMKEFGKVRGLDNITFEGRFRKIFGYLATRGIQKDKKDDSSDDDDRAATKIKQNQKGNVMDIKKARKERIKKNKQAAREEKKVEKQEEREEKKRARAEAQKLKQKLKIHYQRKKQRVERTKAANLKAKALSLSSESSMDSESSDQESNDSTDPSPCPPRKASRAPPATAKKSVVRGNPSALKGRGKSVATKLSTKPRIQKVCTGSINEKRFIANPPKRAFKRKLEEESDESVD
jgi:hypothetical protein